MPVKDPVAKLYKYATKAGARDLLFPNVTPDNVEYMAAVAKLAYVNAKQTGGKKAVRDLTAWQMMHTPMHGELLPTGTFTVPDNMMLVVPACCGFATGFYEEEEKHLTGTAEPELKRQLASSERFWKPADKTYMVLLPGEQMYDLRLTTHPLDMFREQGVMSHQELPALFRPLTWPKEGVQQATFDYMDRLDKVFDSEYRDPTESELETMAAALSTDDRRALVHRYVGLAYEEQLQSALDNALSGSPAKVVAFVRSTVANAPAHMQMPDKVLAILAGIRQAKDKTFKDFAHRLADAINAITIDDLVPLPRDVERSVFASGVKPPERPTRYIRVRGSSVHHEEPPIEHPQIDLIIMEPYMRLLVLQKALHRPAMRAWIDHVLRVKRSTLGEMARFMHDRYPAGVVLFNHSCQVAASSADTPQSCTLPAPLPRQQLNVFAPLVKGTTSPHLSRFSNGTELLQRVNELQDRIHDCRLGKFSDRELVLVIVRAFDEAYPDLHPANNEAVAAALLELARNIMAALRSQPGLAPMLSHLRMVGPLALAADAKAQVPMLLTVFERYVARRLSECKQTKTL